VVGGGREGGVVVLFFSSGATLLVNGVSERVKVVGRSNFNFVKNFYGFFI